VLGLDRGVAEVAYDPKIVELAKRLAELLLDLIKVLAVTAPGLKIAWVRVVLDETQAALSLADQMAANNRGHPFSMGPALQIRLFSGCHGLILQCVMRCSATPNA